MPQKIIFLLLTLATAIAGQAGAAPALATDTYHGVTVVDSYRWLENAADPDVNAWVTAQNGKSRAYLDGLPMRDAIASELKAIEASTSPFDALLRQAGGRLFAMHFEPSAQQPALVTLALSGDPTTRRTIVDPIALNAAGTIAIDWFEPSPDGARIAVSLSENGSEDGTLHIYEVATGKEIEKPIPRVQYPTAGGSLAWTAGADAFWYTRFPDDTAPEADRHFFQQVYFHKLGTESAADPLALSTQDGLPRTAEVFLDNRYAGPNALASVQLGDGGQWQHWLLTPLGAHTLLARYDVRIVAATIGPDGSFYGISYKDALNGKVVKLAAPYVGGAAAAKTIVPEDSAAALVTEDVTTSITISGKRLFVTAIDGGPSVIKVYDLDGGGAELLSTPPVSTVAALEPMPGGDLLYRVRSYTRPSYSMLWQSKTAKSVATPLSIFSPADFSDVDVARAFAVSKDGTKVPLTIFTRKGLKRDGRTPLILTGYGGYGISSTPGFLGAQIYVWMRNGGTYAIANIRGGGEYGERWHQQGNLLNKQNVFDDFYAAARFLIDNQYTSSAKLGITGGSNGGLLMGAMLTQHPALTRAAASFVGIYDMLRVELDPNGTFNVTEFGSVQDAAQFRALYAYSPYHHITKGTAYPAVFLATGDNDARVNPMHSRKFAAALQASGSKRPVYLRTSAKAGHGIGSSLDETIALEADEAAFMFDQLGLGWTASKPSGTR